jgi:hypothetical protein
MEYAVTATSFRLLACERCGRETIQAIREEYRICSGCEAAAFERVAFEAGRRELLR